MSKRQKDGRVLDHALTFHHRLTEFYQRLAEHQQSPRVQLLLDYFTRHQASLEEMIEAYRRQAPPRILEAWFHCDEEDCHLDCLEATDLSRQMSVDEVIQLGAQVNGCMEKNYRRILAGDEPEEVKDFIRDLLTMEVGEQKKLVRNSQQIVDL